MIFLMAVKACLITPPIQGLGSPPALVQAEAARSVVYEELSPSHLSLTNTVLPCNLFTHYPALFSLSLSLRPSTWRTLSRPQPPRRSVKRIPHVSISVAPRRQRWQRILTPSRRVHLLRPTHPAKTTCPRQLRVTQCNDGWARTLWTSRGTVEDVSEMALKTRTKRRRRSDIKVMHHTSFGILLLVSVET